MSPYIEIEVERQLDEIRKQAAQSRLVEQSRMDEKANKSPRTHILARIGKKIAAVGSNLETRFGNQDTDSCDCEYFEYC